MIIGIIVILISLICSAFFSGMEIAYITANKLQIELDRKQQTFFSIILTHILSQPARFIATMLLGNNIALVVYGIFMSKFLLLLAQKILGYKIEYNGWTLFWQTVCSAVIILATAEFIPKALFRIYPNKMLKLFAVPLLVIHYLLLPFTFILVKISNILLRLFGKHPMEKEKIFNKVDLEHYIREKINAIENTSEVDSEIEIFKNALEFGELLARDCMIPRKKMVGLSKEDSIQEGIKLLIKSGFSKLILYNKNMDQVLGYVHSFGFFLHPKELKDILLPVEFVSETKPAKDVLNLLIQKRTSMAIILDEYGGTAGMLTLEDIIEELFGDIVDEYDKELLQQHVIGTDSFKFSARLEVDYLNKKYNLNLPKSDKYDTIGGLIINHTEEIPEVGHILMITNYAIEIIKATSTNIEEIKLSVIDSN